MVKKHGQSRVRSAQRSLGSVAEHVGCDLGEPVSEDYGPRGNEFNSKAKWVQIDVDAAARDVDQMIGAEERLQFAMTRQ